MKNHIRYIEDQVQVVEMSLDQLERITGKCCADMSNAAAAITLAKLAESMLENARDALDGCRRSLDAMKHDE
ncbi:hypothetical protein [Pseudohaliea sp.]|uniref:hypothetical protein n=1 Tax=Pseudohaliea sp. TaxID=2740289 RepID=UPI0032ED84CA